MVISGTSCSAAPRNDGWRSSTKQFKRSCTGSDATRRRASWDFRRVTWHTNSSAKSIQILLPAWPTCSAQERALGNGDEAMLYQQALRIRRATLGNDHSDVLEIVSLLTKMELDKPGRVVSTQSGQQPQVDSHLSFLSQQVDQLFNQGHYDQALAVAKQACQFADLHY